MTYRYTYCTWVKSFNLEIELHISFWKWLFSWWWWDDYSCSKQLQLCNVNEYADCVHSVIQEHGSCLRHQAHHRTGQRDTAYDERSTCNVQSTKILFKSGNMLHKGSKAPSLENTEFLPWPYEYQTNVVDYLKTSQMIKLLLHPVRTIQTF